MGRVLAASDGSSVTPLPVSAGGTGSKDKVNAARNLGGISKSELFDAQGKIQPSVIPAGVLGGVNITGSTLQLYTGQTGTYQISNYDNGVTYTVTAASGTVSLNGVTITYVAPSTANANAGFSVNGKAVVINVVAPSVNQTTITSPTAGATGQGSSVSFTSAAFAVSGATDTHAASDWQIATDAGFSNIVASVTASATNLTSWTASGLVAGTTYYARCRHKGTTLGYGAWSATVSFSTKSSFLGVYYGSCYANDAFSSLMYGVGLAISADGKTVAIGARENGLQMTNAGCVYVLVFSGGLWSQQVKLGCPLPVAYDFFGDSLALTSDGNTLVIGAYGREGAATNSGVVYVYNRTGTSWTLSTSLYLSSIQGRGDSSSGVSNEYFGYSVAISGDGTTIVVGSYGYTAYQTKGSVFVYTYNGSSWDLSRRLVPDDLSTTGGFGYSVGISTDGSVIVAGDPDNTSFGAAYVFVKTNGVLTQQAKLTTTDVAAGDRFGRVVSISGDGKTIAVSASAYPLGNCIGRVYVFKQTGTSWQEQARLDSISPNQVNQQFGFSVALDYAGTFCVIGSPYFDTGSGIMNAGVPVVWKNTNGTWSAEYVALDNGPLTNDCNGYKVAISKDASVWVTSAPMHSLSYSNCGKITIYM